MNGKALKDFADKKERETILGAHRGKAMCFGMRIERRSIK